ncbi:hypothetical protein FHR49_004146 [Xanthomonas campestris]
MNNLNLLIFLLGQEEHAVAELFIDIFGPDARLTRYVGPLGDRVYHSLCENGIQLIFDKNKLEQITLYVQSSEGFNPYGGDLPFGLSTEMHLDEVSGLLGLPNSNGGGNDDPLLGRIPYWIIYEDLRPQIHIEFDSMGGIEKISLS